MRAAVYARYSSDTQREASIEDQLEVCRRYIVRQGWTQTASFDDRAASGASARLRPGYQSMLIAAEAGEFDVLVCEAVDRLGRNLADIAALFDRLSFRRVTIHSTQQGLITQMHIGVMGTMAQMMLSDLREKTRRGQLGRARAGRIPGGLAYGYRVVPPPSGATEAGERRIEPAEAAIVRRIFTDYAAGQSPRRIAACLNAERIPGPGGRPWGDTTIRGQVDRGTGILNNTLYIGQLSWNRCSYVKDPRTGKRVARVNSTDQHEVRSIPELRIVDDALWQQVRARQQRMRFEVGRDTTGNTLNRAHRRDFLLSGVLTCGRCGGGYTIVAKDRYGCATRRGKGTCDNRRTIARRRIETRVLAGLKDRLITPELVEEFVRTFAEETARLRRETGARQQTLHRRLADIERRLSGVLSAIENGAWNETLRSRLTELEQQKAALTTELSASATVDAVPRLHPNAATIYRDKVAALETSLNEPSIRPEAAEALRALITTVALTPDADAPDGLRAELYGDLAEVLALAASAERRGAGAPPLALAARGNGGLLSVVAGARCHLYRTRLPYPAPANRGRSGTARAS